MIIGKHQSNQREISRQRFYKLREYIFLQITKIEIQRVYSVIIFLALLCLQYLAY